MRVALRLVPLALVAACAGEPSDAHPWLTTPGVAGHEPYLLLAGTPHDPSLAGAPVSCEGCHPGESFRTFECTGCHGRAAMDPIHSAASGYVAGAVASADCYACHPRGIGLTPATHSRLFPIETAAHPAVCTQCHADSASRQDVARLLCASCHARQPSFGTAHARVKDYPLAPTSEWCLRCHADGRVLRIADHGRLPGPEGDGGPGDGDHDTHCFQCHTMVPPLPLFGGPPPGVPDLPWAQDWAAVTCDRCH
jgi:hypothetical protein